MIWAYFDRFSTVFQPFSYRLIFHLIWVYILARSVELLTAAGGLFLALLKKA